MKFFAFLFFAVAAAADDEDELRRAVQMAVEPATEPAIPPRPRKQHAARSLWRWLQRNGGDCRAVRSTSAGGLQSVVDVPAGTVLVRVPAVALLDAALLRLPARARELTCQSGGTLLGRAPRGWRSVPPTKWHWQSVHVCRAIQLRGERRHRAWTDGHLHWCAHRRAGGPSLRR